MSIEAVGASTNASLWEMVNNSGKKEDQDATSLFLGSKGGDTATFSAAALTKLSESQTEQNPKQGEADGGAGKGASGASGSSSADSIEAQIAQLQGKIASIQQSSLPDGTKAAQISALQAQISALQAQLG